MKPFLGHSSEDEPPYKMSHLDMDSHQYRPEYDNIYTNSPGPCAPPSHRAHFGSWDSDYGSYRPYGRRDGLHSDGLHGDQLGDRHDLATLRDSPELSRFNEAKRYSLRDEDNYSPIPREVCCCGFLFPFIKNYFELLSMSVSVYLVSHSYSEIIQTP